MRARRLTAALLLASLLVLSAAAAWPQGTSAGFTAVSAGKSAAASASTYGEARVVAAWTFTRGAARPDPGVSVAASERRQYDLVKIYVWNALPPDTRSRVSRLQLFESSSSAADATDGTATENEDGVTWTLALDAQEGKSAVIGGKLEDREVFDEVIAHEVGHVLSLNDRQRADNGEDPGYSDGDDTFSLDAYISRYYRWFWRSLWPAAGTRGKAGTRAQADPGSRARETSARYDQDPDAFVTKYAATSPSEDFAESFAYFVLEPAPQGYTLRDRKIRFFYGYPELVIDRQYLRRGLSSCR